MSNPNTANTQTPAVAPAKVAPASGSPVQPKATEAGAHQPQTQPAPTPAPTPKI